MRKLALIIFVACGLAASRPSEAQELQANVTVIADKIKNTDPAVFATLQNGIKDFLNSRRWTDRIYRPEEKIACNFLLDIQQQPQQNVYTAYLTVQSSRPVYNSAYNSPLFSYLDKNVVFRYIQYQPFNFNENRISGDDPLVANLTAILAYYANIIIGMDNDSFAPSAGVPYFKKAQYIVSNAPEDSKNISGWKPFESNRNRYWLADNLLNQRLSAFHEVMYRYHRLGLDKMYDNRNSGRAAILDCLNTLNTINADNPNTMILQLFFLAKSEELAGVFSKSARPDRVRAADLLSQLDPSNASKYRQLAQ